MSQSMDRMRPNEGREDDPPQRRRIGLLHKVSYALVFQIGSEQLIEMMIGYRVGRGGKAEQIIHRRGDFERALVAVAHHARDPFWIGSPATHHTGDFMAQRPRQWRCVLSQNRARRARHGRGAGVLGAREHEPRRAGELGGACDRAGAGAGDRPDASIGMATECCVSKAF